MPLFKVYKLINLLKNIPGLHPHVFVGYNVMTVQLCMGPGQLTMFMLV